MFDFTLIPKPNGTLFQSNTDSAKDWVSSTFNMLADPIMDDVGVDMMRRMLEAEGLTAESK